MGSRLSEPSRCSSVSRRGGTTQRVHPRDRLLPAVAALVEVYGGRDPAHLVGDGAVVGVLAEARLAASDPQRLERPHAAGRAGRVGVLLELGAREHVVLAAVIAVVPDPRCSAGDASDAETGRQATARSSVRSSTSTRIMNRIRSSHAASGAASPGSTWAVKASPSSTPYIACSTCPWAKDQRRGRYAGPQGLEVLGRQRVQPRQPVGSADPDHATVREVHEPVAGSQRALLTVERAVVRRHGRVDAVAAHRAGKAQQGLGVGLVESVTPSLSLTPPRPPATPVTAGHTPRRCRRPSGVRSQG